MRILINERLSEHRAKTPEGYLVCTDAILARTGRQTYRKNEIFNCDEDIEIDVDRKPEEVFSKETIASFENKPVTVEHPNEDVNSNNYKEYAVGFVRDVHKGEYNGQEVLLGTLIITDQKTIEEIENGEHCELSCGYDCDILDEENPQQTHIRGNHVALCEHGRAGIAKIIDSIEDRKEDGYYTYRDYLLFKKNGRWWLMYKTRVVKDFPTNKEAEEYVDEVKAQKDSFVEVSEDLQRTFERMLKSEDIGIVRKGRTWSGKIHYQVEADKKPEELFRIINKIGDFFKHRFKIPVTCYVSGENGFSTAGIDLDNQLIKE